MATIQISQGYEVTVDDQDAAWLSEYRWFAHVTRKPGGTKVYARANGQMVNWQKAPPIYMHRLILDAPKGVLCDHINGDGLDNRRSNLRLATAGQNSMNSRKRSGPVFKGVYPSGRRFQVKIQKAGEGRFLGCFATAEEAARAYDAAAIELFGEFAYLNFPSEIPNSRGS